MAVVLYRYHGLPYLASWDHNFPGIVLLHAASMLCFGNSMFGFHLFEYLWQVATLFLLCRVARLWVSENAALLACLLFALYYVQGHSAVMGQRDGFSILPLLLASLAIVEAYRSTSFRGRLLLFSGASYGFAAALRPTSALLMPVALLTLFGIQRLWKGAWFYTVIGFGAILLLFLLPYLVVPNGVEQAWNSAVRFNLDVYTPMAARLASSAWFNRYPMLCYGLFAGWMLSLAVYRQKQWRLMPTPISAPEKRFVFASLVALLVSILMMRSLLTYQFTPFYALFLPIPAMLALDWKTRLGTLGTVGFALLLLAAAALYPWRMVVPFVRQGMSLQAAYSEEDRDTTYGFRPSVEVSGYINSIASPHESVAILTMGDNPLWEVERPPASRFVTAKALLFREPDGALAPYQIQWRAQFMQDLIRSRPKLIVFENQSPLRTGLYGIPGFATLFQESYYQDTILHGWCVYSRKE